MARLGLRAAKVRRLGVPSRREVARIAELERLLTAAETRDDVASSTVPHGHKNEMDPAAIVTPVGSDSEPA